jgi:hypothetical protein
MDAESPGENSLPGLGKHALCIVLVELGVELQPSEEDFQLSLGRSWALFGRDR